MDAIFGSVRPPAYLSPKTEASPQLPRRPIEKSLIQRGIFLPCCSSCGFIGIRPADLPRAFVPSGCERTSRRREQQLNQEKPPCLPRPRWHWLSSSAPLRARWPPRPSTGSLPRYPAQCRRPDTKYPATLTTRCRAVVTFRPATLTTRCQVVVTFIPIRTGISSDQMQAAKYTDRRGAAHDRRAASSWSQPPAVGRTTPATGAPQ